MDLKRPGEMYCIFLGLREWPECPRKSRSFEILKPGGDPQEALGGRGRPWAAGAAAAGRPGRRLGGSGDASWRGRMFPPGVSVGGGDHASCAKCPQTEPKSSFSRGRRPRPLAGIPAPPEHAHRLHWTRFRVLLRATLLPDGCPVGVRRQVWTARGGCSPPEL